MTDETKPFPKKIETPFSPLPSFKNQMEGLLNTSLKRQGSEVMLIEHTTNCGEQKLFKCVKTFQMWERLHLKKCALCRRVPSVFQGVDRDTLAKSAYDQQYKNMMRKQYDSRMDKLSRHI